MAGSVIKLEDRSFFRKRWPLFFFVVLVGIITSYVINLKSPHADGDKTFEMVYGIMGICLVIFLSFYKLRASIYRTRLGPTQIWLQAHVYIGLLSTVLIFIHSGFNLSWNFSYFLFILFFFVIISGVIGSLIYKTIPLSVSKYGKEIITPEEVIDSLEQYLINANKSVSNASDKFKEVYKKHIKPFFQSKKPNWGYLFMEEQELLNKRKLTFESLKKIIPAKEIYDWNILNTVLIEREKLAFKGVKLNLLRVWLNIHMPLVFAMLTAAVFHVLSIIYF